MWNSLFRILYLRTSLYIFYLNIFLNRLTFYDEYKLKIGLWDHDGLYGEANYQHFKVLPEHDNYKLILGPFLKETDHLFLTRVGDSFSGHNFGKFSTKDRDNDLKGNISCAIRHKTAGWLKRCLSVNIFGSNMDEIQTARSWMGISWKSFRGARYSLNKLTMAIQPIRHHLSGSYCKQSYIKDNINFVGITFKKILSTYLILVNVYLLYFV